MKFFVTTRQVETNSLDLRHASWGGTAMVGNTAYALAILDRNSGALPDLVTVLADE